MFRIYIFLVSALLLISCQQSSQKTSKEAAIDKNIMVGVFNGNGAGAISVIETIESLKIDPNMEAFPISASEIMQGKLSELDALVFPGGSGSKQLNNLGKLGKEQVVDFVEKEGKGVLGICAGAYMLCNTPTYESLRLSSVKHIDRAHYARGRGLVAFQLNETGYTIFPELKKNNQFLQYYDGPVMEVLNDHADIEVLGEYVTDIHPNKGMPTGITPGQVFIYTEKVGEGNIFAIAGHPESTPGMRWMVPRMIRHITHNEIIAYDEKWIKPALNDHPILFTDSLKKVEKTYWWALFNDQIEEQKEAMHQLYTMRSRPAVRWNVGLLRDKNPEIRALAAELLKDAEYTYAMKDLEVALDNEEDSITKQAIIKSIDFLKY